MNACQKTKVTLAIIHGGISTVQDGALQLKLSWHMHNEAFKRRLDFNRFSALYYCYINNFVTKALEYKASYVV